ncbi:MAG: UDP-N-acetylmuramoyl-tripeptide--D-alanyl-D-alanine ligase [Gemmatimonadota bacterium]|nr:UDP-N-acetylmuramoyl-tripeptide--D-alanyl-D-alanine ligase [Gemmatimonadota bacterium]
MTDSFWSLSRVAKALAGRGVSRWPHGDVAIERVWTDTRTVRRGDLFVALAGERFDAHDFLAAAVSAGARALVVRRTAEAVGLGVPVFVVDDTLVALGDLARYRRLAWGGVVVAVAGSNGKTSTKELLRAALGSTLTVHATTGNLNNRVGVPLTLLAMDADVDVGVIEVGSSIPGEIAILREITRPDIAIVTSIAEEHLEGFGDLAGVLKEETSVFHNVAVGIVPITDPELAAASSPRRLVRAGLDEGEVCATSWKIDADGAASVIVDGTFVRSTMRGVHNLRNLMLAIAAALELGVKMPDVAAGISALVPPPMRASWQQMGRALVINDAYNSNPGSALAAIEMLTSAPGEQKVAVLGTMLELGADSDRCHEAVALAALGSPVSIIAGIGEFARALRHLAPENERVVLAEDVDDLWVVLAPRLRPDATILLKASRGAKLERILPHISSWSDRDC